MSLPTFIKLRQTPRPEDYLARHLNVSAQQAMRILQLYKKWQEEDVVGYYINQTKRHVRPFWLVPKLLTEQQVTLAPAGAPGDRVPGITFEIDTQGHFEIAYSMFQADSSDFVVTIMDGGNNNKQLMNTDVHAATIAGNAQRPLIWPETYFLNVQNAPRQLTMNFRNLSPLQNRVRWCFHGRRWYHMESPPEVQRKMEERWGRMEKTYTYFITLSLAEAGYGPSTPEGANPPGLTLAAGQALIENAAPIFWATDEADTEVHKLAAISTGPFEFQLREAQSGRTLSNGFIQVTNGWGDGQFPFIFAETFLFERNYKVLFEVRDLSGAPNIIYPTMIGRRLQYA
ncbi:MAG: hypothetical protein ACRDZ4_14565 [Egibacteraceae bacterium]